MANGQILSPVLWADACWQQISYFALTYFHSVFTVTHTQNFPFLWTSASEDSQNFVTYPGQVHQPQQLVFHTLNPFKIYPHEHEGLSDPRLDLLEIYHRFIIKNCK